MEELKLTQFSPGAGCGCKISPKDLEEILKSNIKGIYNENLLVGYDTKDDAAVFEIGNGQAIISTTDFFTPIVDNPFDFGRIAATNAISDIFAMGGKPLMAIAILGWPLEKLPASVAQQVVDGARTVCNNANIPLAGGHSIDISDPIFGLAVTGIVPVSNIKKNCNASDKCRLFLTKPIGIGILTTAEKRGLLKAEHNNLVIQLMTTLNNVGEELGNNIHIKAMTDVTGFGLLGHLLELCEGSNINAEIEYKKIPLIEGIDEYITHKTFPGGTYRNWKSYGHKSQLADESYKFVVCDPQTSGGLLVAVEEDGLNDFKNSCKKFNIEPIEIGFTKARINSTNAFVNVL